MDPIDELLTRGVDTIYPTKEALEKVLRSGKKLRLYQGFDPSGDKLHIGHAVGMRKHRQFQDLGHEVIFLVGDGTGQAGDPSGKKTAREKFFTQEELRANARDYIHQAAKIVRFEGPNPIKILYNGDWLNKLNLIDILNLAQHFSVQQLLERDIFQERIKRGESINLREFIYPLLQAYDSVHMKVDLELGGTDQTFNMLAGRTLVAAMQGREKFVMTVPLLTDAKGTKLGKSEGNVIGITDPPNDFYGEIMSLGDDSIIPCFTLLTNLPLSEIDKMEQSIIGGENPMTYKKKLAYELTKQINTESEAKTAQEYFEKTYQQGQLSSADLPTVSYKTLPTNVTIVDFLIQTDLVETRAEAKRLLRQKAVEYNNEIITDDKYQITPAAGDIIKVGKKRHLKLVE